MSVFTCEELVWGIDELVCHFDCGCVLKRKSRCIMWRIVCYVLQQCFMKLKTESKAKNVRMVLQI